MNISMLDLIGHNVSEDMVRAESLKLDFALGLMNLLKKNDISFSQLAKNVGTSQAYVSKVLRGDTNVTIETMVKLASGAKGQVHLRVSDAGKNFCWAGRTTPRRLPVSGADSRSIYAFTGAQRPVGSRQVMALEAA